MSRSQKSTSPPRLWWCPAGLFSFLPVHAAGIYGRHIEEECVSDYIISSYTPTLDLLLRPKSTRTQSFKMLAVVLPETPGQEPLLNVRDELLEIQRYVPSGSLDVLGMRNIPASMENVSSHLRSSSFVHFACHGMQDPDDPLESAVILEDGLLKVSQLIERPNDAPLAFLSACETATGSEDLPDEVIHLAATFLVVGFRGVVATM